MAIDPKDESLPDDYYEPRNFNPKIWWSSVAVICIFAVIGFIVIPESFRRRMQYENQNYRPGKLYKLETDLVATNRDGRKISFSKEIYGKKSIRCWLSIHGLPVRLSRDGCDDEVVAWRVFPKNIPISASFRSV